MTSTQDRLISTEEEKAFAVFATAIERYLETVDEEGKKNFESWLENHISDDELFSHLLQTFPRFGEVFAEEIEKFGEIQE